MRIDPRPLAACLLLLSTAAFAQVRFEASVPSESVRLGDTVEVTVTLERDGTQPFDAYRAPSAPDFDLLHTGNSEQMQWATVNGKQTVRMVEQHDYVFRPHKKGVLTIGSASIRIGGRELHTRAITIRVASAPRNAASTPQTPNSLLSALPAPPDSMRGDEDLFVDARLDKDRVYVGQQVTASWRLYTRTEILKYRDLAEPQHQDFWSEDLYIPSGHLNWDRQIIHGQEYAVALLLKKALFPLKTGKLTITPLEAEATTLQTAFFANGSDTAHSPSLTVEVLPLPAAGRPAGFQPTNVGHYELHAAVDRPIIKAGEAVTWTLTVDGAGNLRNVKLPKLDSLDGWKAYEPTTREVLEPGDEVRGQKIYTYLLMPTRGGKVELPAVALPYFDPDTGKYAVARSAPVAVTVEGDPSKVAGTTAAPTQENVLAQQIRPIHARAEVRSNFGEQLWRGRLGEILLAVPPGIWLIVLVVDALRRRLARETARSKRRRARRTARRRLRVAEYHIKAQRPSAFFGECARVIYEHLEYRLGAKVEALTLAELRAHLEARGFPKETADATVRELENCDFARFAPSASGPGEMRAAMRRVRTLLGWIEKVKPQTTEKEAAA